MTDSIQIFPTLWQFSDANGDPVAGGTIEAYVAGSSTPLTVYSDAALTSSIGTTVYCDSSGYTVASSGSSTKVNVYTGTAAYKLVFKTSAGSTLATLDNIKGAIDTSGFQTTTAAPVLNVVAKASTTWTATTADLSGTLYNANVAGGSQVATLPSAVTAGNGYTLGIRHDGQGSSNTVTYQTVSTQTIKEGGDAPSSAGTLTGYGETRWFTSDGANWTVSSYVPPLMQAGQPIQVVDRLTAAPASPAAGAIYLINGTPTGTWSTLGFDEHDLVQANGAGGWVEYSPPTDCGWLAYVQDEDLLIQFRGSAWVDLNNITAPATSYRKLMVLRHDRANGTAGGAATSASRQTYPLTTFVNDGAVNVITGATLTTNTISDLPVGRYRIDGFATFVATDDTQLFLRNSTTSTDLVIGQVIDPDSTAAARLPVLLSGEFAITTATDDLVIQYRCQTSRASDGLGIASSFSDTTEVYGIFIIESLEMIQGTQGMPGAQGAPGTDGALGMWNFETSTSSGPASGGIRFNNATFASVSEVYLHESDLNGTGLASLIASWDDSTSTVKGVLLCRKNGSGSNFFAADVTALTDNGSDVTMAVTYRSSSGSFSAGDDIGVVFIPKGDKGDTGAAGSNGAAGATGAAGPSGATGPNVGLDYTLSTSTSGDPGSGKLLVDNATPASATALHISKTNRLSASQAAYLATWDDGTTTSDKGVVRILDVAAPGTNFLEYRITGTLTDVGSYDTFPVAYINGAGTIANASTVAVLFSRTGDKGADGAGTGDVTGPAASVDSEIALFSSTTGKVIKRASTTGLLKGTSGVLSAAVAGTDYVAPGGALGTPSSGTLTNATGLPISTGVSGLGTGVATALAVNVGSAGAPVVLNGAGGTPSSITLTNGTGLPVSGITSSTSTALGVGSLELGHATDTTLARSAAGEVTIEGTLIKKVGKETIWIPAAAMTARTTNGAAAGTSETTTNKVMLSTLDFDTTTQEYAQFFIRMPKSWNEGTVTFQAVGSRASGSNTGVVFELAGLALGHGDTIDSAFGTAQTSVFSSGNSTAMTSTGVEYHGTVSSAITIAGTPAAEDWVVFQVSRVVGNASDDMTADARLHGVTLYFTTDASTDA